jgi:hypothetical protein
MPDTGLAPTGGKMHMIFGKRAFFGYGVFDDGSGDGLSTCRASQR